MLQAKTFPHSSFARILPLRNFLAECNTYLNAAVHSLARLFGNHFTIALDLSSHTQFVSPSSSSSKPICPRTLSTNYCSPAHFSTKSPDVCFPRTLSMCAYTRRRKNAPSSTYNPAFKQVRKETIGLQTVRTRKPTTNAIALSLYRLSRSLSFR
jgi:hypothetical protein